VIKKGEKQIDRKTLYLAWQKQLLASLNIAIGHYEKFNCECDVCKRLRRFLVEAKKDVNQ
jgi:hypothetical protein